jgi:GNAT superfamily N-acetyltransferase
MAQFIPYQPEYFEKCLTLFDANCPESFAPNERDDYAEFLNQVPTGYLVSLHEDQVIGAFGLIQENTEDRRRLNWIMIDSSRQGAGFGRAMMEYVLAQSKILNVQFVDIAASHKSAAFFERFGAKGVKYTEHGWGPGMHRLDMELELA